MKNSDFNVNKVWDFLESQPFYNKNFMPKFNTAREIYDEFSSSDLKLYSAFKWDDYDGVHYREKRALRRRANYNQLKANRLSSEKKRRNEMKLKEVIRNMVILEISKVKHGKI